MNDNHFNVKAVCKLTGLNEHTLRAWERRYGAIVPDRQENRRRVYTRDDVERLKWLVGLVEQGYAIGQIAGLADRELRDLVAQHELLAKPSQAAEAVEEPRANDPSASPHIAALRKLDLEALQLELERSRLMHGARDLLLKVILPLMGEVGRLVMNDELEIGQEHAFSALVRAQLMDILFQLKRLKTVVVPTHGSSRKRVVVATPEGDLHEIGILAGAILCADAGLDVAYLGPNMPPDSLGRVAAVLRADAVLLGLMPLPPSAMPRTVPEYLNSLAQLVQPRTELWLGGVAPPEDELHGIPRRMQRFSTMKELIVGVARAASSTP
jgi:MerR family transcriptional regulator, light-induced transcriptional regulator